MASTSDSYGSYGQGYGIKYPDPFFDLSQNYIPNNVKKLFKYCHAFFHTDPFLSNVVRKITEYPITELLYDQDVSVETRKKYDYILHDKLKIKQTLVEIGLDYNTYGNCFVTCFMKTKRYLVHPETNERMPIDQVKYKYKRHKFYITDDKTGMELECQVEDDTIKSLESFKLVRWNPENIEIDYNPITGESEYYYQIPNSIQKKILTGDKHIIETIPMVFIEAVKEKKRVHLEKKNLYHFKRPGLSESDMG